jgi:hypothetical protein
VAVDFATLALRVDNTDAVKKLDDTGKALDNVSAKASKTTVTVEQSRLAWQRSGGDMSKFGQELQKMAGVQSTFAGTTERATAAAEKHHLSIGRVNLALESLASEALGANARLGSLAAKFTEFGIGSAETAGVLAGVAAIALAWEKLNESTRKANEETQKAIGLLREVRLKKLLGPGGETGDAVEKAKGQLPLEIQKQDQLTAGLASFGKDQLSIRALQIRQELADQRSKVSEMKALISDGEEEVTRLKKEAADKVAEDRQSAFDKEYEAWKSQINRIVELAKNTSDPLAKLLADAEGPKQRSEELDKIGARIAGTSLTAGTQVNQQRINGTFADSQIIPRRVFDELYRFGFKTAGAAVELERLMNVAKKVSDEEARKLSLKNTATNAGLSLLGQTGEAGSTLSGIFSSGISAASGGPWGIAIAGAGALGSSLIAFGQSARLAREQMKAFATAFDDTILSWRAELGQAGASKALRANQIHEQAQALRDQLNVDPFTARLLSQQQRDEIARRLHEVNEVEAQRIAALNKEKDAIDGVNQAMVNMVQGYRLQAAIFRASNPHRNPFTPTGPNPYIPPGGVGPISGDGMTIQVVMDSHVIGTAVIRDFRARSQAQTGDASNWTELRA